VCRSFSATTDSSPSWQPADGRKADHVAALTATSEESLFGHPKRLRFERPASAAVGRLLKRLHVGNMVAMYPELGAGE
jgi:hypothetical protein